MNIRVECPYGVMFTPSFVYVYNERIEILCDGKNCPNQHLCERKGRIISLNSTNIVKDKEAKND